MRVARLTGALALLLAPGVVRAQDGLEHFLPPARVAVRPVFVVPAGQREPGQDEHAALVRHLRIARNRFTDMLGGRDSFALVTVPQVVRVPESLPALRAAPYNAAPLLAARLLEHFGVTRFECPWIFVAIVMNDEDDAPTGAGAPLNGGLNLGGGIIVMSSFALDRIPNVQSTVQHELGHAFGLPHVEDYGRDMRTDASIMSYNPAHHTRGFGPSPTPGILAREDLRALARNRRVFASLAWDSSAADTALPRLRQYGPMNIPGHPVAAIDVTTPSGSLYGSLPASTVRGEIPPSPGPAISFDAATMWHSDSTGGAWVSLELAFPVALELTRIRIATGHSGGYHAALRARVTTLDDGREIADAPLAGMEDAVAFAPARARRWRVELLAGPRHMVVVRGLRFFDGTTELFARQ